MPTLLVYSSDNHTHVLAILRYHQAAQANGWHIIFGKEGEYNIYPERVDEADVVLITRDFPRFFPSLEQIITRARAQAKPILYDIDDLLIAMPPHHPTRGDYKDALGGMMYTITAVDQLIVSTPALRNLLLPLQPNIAIWPTLLPDDLWRITPPQPSSPQPTAPLTIGYMGGISHIPDVALLTPVFQALLQDPSRPVRLKFWGCPPAEEIAQHPHVTQVHLGIKNYADFAQDFSTHAHADIWLAPLQDNQFNHCKSPIKFWEYSAIGGVGVYSRLEPYTQAIQEEQEGLFATTAEQWLHAIRRLIDNPALRLRLAQNAQQKLKQEGLLSTQLHRWQKIITTAVSQPNPTPPPLAQMLQRHSQLVQHRADERHQEALAAMNDTQTLLHTLQHRTHLLQERSDQLEAIIQNPRWQQWQRLKRLARLNFSPPTPHQPFEQLSLDILNPNRQNPPDEANP